MSASEFLNRAKKRAVKKSEITEADIEGEFCKQAKKSGCSALKLIFLNKKGFPDRTVLCPGGKVFFIEFKKKGKKQSPIQKVVQKSLESFGFQYYVCDEIGQAEKHLNRFLNVKGMEAP